MTLCGHMTISQRDEGVHLPSPLCHRNMVQCIAGLHDHNLQQNVVAKILAPFFPAKKPCFHPPFPSLTPNAILRRVLSIEPCNNISTLFLSEVSAGCGKCI